MLLGRRTHTAENRAPSGSERDWQLPAAARTYWCGNHASSSCGAKTRARQRGNPRVRASHKLFAFPRLDQRLNLHIEHRPVAPGAPARDPVRSTRTCARIDQARAFRPRCRHCVESEIPAPSSATSIAARSREKVQADRAQYGRTWRLEKLREWYGHVQCALAISVQF